VSDALDLLHALVLEDGRRWGEAAVPEQVADAEAILDPESPTPFHYLTRSRGYSKTCDLGGVAIAAMLAQLPPVSRSYAVAADADQGRLLLDAVRGFATRTEELRGALDVQAARVVATRTGSTLEAVPADAASAWGLRPHLVVVDELSGWPSTSGPRRLWEAVTSAVAKVPGSRLAVITTAGDPAHWSRRVLDHALGDPLWRVHEVAGPAPWLDPERVEEQRRRLPEAIYRRLFLNEWVAADDRLAAPDDLRACVTLTGPLPPEPGRTYAVGLDVGLKRDRTVATVVHGERIVGAEGDTVGVRVVLDRIHTWQGSRLRPVRLAEVEEWLAQAARDYNRATIRFDPYQAAGTVQRLRDRGVRCEEFTFSPSSVARLAVTLLTLIRDRALALPDDEELLDELATVRIRETSPGVLRMDHDSDRHDDRAVALALAASYVVERFRTPMKASVHVYRPRAPQVSPALRAVRAPQTITRRH
jgi:hypothetical protein